MTDDFIGLGPALSALLTFLHEKCTKAKPFLAETKRLMMPRSVADARGLKNSGSSEERDG